MAIAKVIFNGTTLMDVTSATAEASDIASPKTAMLANGVVTTGTGGGIGGEVTQDENGNIHLSNTTEQTTLVEKDVNFIDYDGTLVASKTKAEINAMTSDSDLPANPTHTGLTAQGWNWTVAQLKAQLTAMPDAPIWVGQMYVTTSGATEIDVEMQEGRLSPILTICVNGTVTVDWGDGTTTNTVTGTSLAVRLEVGPHDYVSAGNYTISISAAVGSSYAFLGSNGYQLLRKNTTGDQNKVYSSDIKRIRLGNNITTIGSSTFYNCLCLESITISSSVTSIGDSAFYNCYFLKSITIPSGVTIIKGSTFQYCYSIKNIAIPSSVTSFETAVFNDCHLLESITLPSGSTFSWSSSSFANCYSLKSITLPSGVTTIIYNGFKNCYCLESVTFLGNITTIEESAFAFCYSLKSITIPSSVTSIGKNAFQYCYNLKNLTIPNLVTSIGNTAFSYCYALRSIIMSNNLSSIGSGAFQYCYCVASVTIPSSVTSIGESAFRYWYGVREIHVLPTTVPSLGSTNTFSGIPSDCVIYVPSASLTDYQGATGWSDYASYIQAEPQQ